MYQLDRNEGDNLLHGGATGFHRVLWDAREVNGALVLTHESPEGDAGFPGALATIVRYALDDNGALTIDYDARRRCADARQSDQSCVLQFVGGHAGAGRCSGRCSDRCSDRFAD